MIRNCFVLSFVIFFLTACSTPRPLGPEVGPRLDSSDYAKTIHRNTKFEKKYDGFYQLYEAHLTFVDSEVQTAILQKKSDVYLWNAETAQKEREKMFQENSNSSHFILIFYTPRPRLNELHRKNSIWEIFIEVNGQRYPADVKRVQGPFEHTAAIYPDHNRFTTAYELVFKVPLGAIEKNKPKVVIASTLGRSEFEF